MQVKINHYKVFIGLLFNSVVPMYHINRIEAIQSRAARFVFNDFSRYSSITSMLSTPNLAET